jgi:hypothetical protein
MRAFNLTGITFSIKGGEVMYWFGVIVDLLSMGLFMYWVIIQPEKGA